jgi:very-short-patch-repair endonuclease
MSGRKQSRGERAVREYMDARGLQYVAEYRARFCRSKRSLPFDFAVQTRSGLLFIEFDGIQHFEEVDGFGGLAGRNGTQMRDDIKTQFCANRGIPLIRIRYDEINEVDAILARELAKYDCVKSVA